MSTQSNALATLADVKDFMRITTTDDDALIERLIDAVSDRIARFCDRKFEEATYKEWHNGASYGAIKLRHFPVTTVNHLAYGETTAIDVTSTDSTDLISSVEVQDDEIRLYRVTSSGVAATTSLANGTYPSASDMVTQISATAGFSATLLNNYPSGFFHRMGGQSVLGNTVSITYPSESGINYRVDQDRGLLWLIQTDTLDDLRWGGSMARSTRHVPSAVIPTGFLNLFIQYVGGYATIPDDLAQIAIEIIHDLYHRGKSDPNMQSERLGDYSYQRGVEDVLSTNEGLRLRLAQWCDIR